MSIGACRSVSSVRLLANDASVALRALDNSMVCMAQVVWLVHAQLLWFLLILHPGAALELGPGKGCGSLEDQFHHRLYHLCLVHGLNVYPRISWP